VIIGANIGTTITAQLIAFKLTKIAPFFIFFGALIFFASKKHKHKNKGLAIMGFGLLFLGLSTMTGAVKPLAGNENVRNLFITFGKNPLLGILVGLIATVILQSSSTTIGIVIALASAGLLKLPAAIYLVLGDNIGTCITAIIASIGGNLSSKRLALGHTLFNITGTLIALPLIPLYLYFIPLFSNDISRQIANTHMIFNLVNALIFLAFIPLYIKFLKKLLPGDDYKKEESRFLDKNLLKTPNLATVAVVKELSNMLGICRQMFNKASICLLCYSHKYRKELEVEEDSVDDMQKEITDYIVDITRQQLSKKHAMLLPALIHSANDIERAADYCMNIADAAEKLYEDDLNFSEMAKKELEEMFAITREIMMLAQMALQDDDHKAADKSIGLKRKLSEDIEYYRLKHIKRLEKLVCSNSSGLIFNDVLIFVERINTQLCNITKGILHIGKR